MDLDKKLEVISQMHGKAKYLSELLAGYGMDIKDNEKQDGWLEMKIGDVISELDGLNDDLWFGCETN